MSGSVRSVDYDAVVVGARCAGAATAMLLARRGLRVLMIDRGRYGSDTLSTHALMRAGVLQLHRWGILERIRAAGTPVIHATSFHYADDIVNVAIKPQNGVDGLYAPRRTIIDALLVDAARDAGAEVAFDTRLIDLMRGDDGRVSGVRLRCCDGPERQVTADLVIGADGVRSTVAGLVGAAPYRVAGHTTAVLFSYWSGMGIDGYHWYFRPGVSAGVVPTNDGLTCVFVSAPPSRFHEEQRGGRAASHRRLVEECDAQLSTLVDEAERAEDYRGFSGQVGFFRRSFGPGWALVGDAGYFKDPLTAHGITDAFIDAELLANAAAEGTERALARYQTARDERATGLFEVTDAVASFEWDLATVQQLHRSLSDELKKETLGVPLFGCDASGPFVWFAVRATDVHALERLPGRIAAVPKRSPGPTRRFSGVADRTPGTLRTRPRW
jgi:2-polyprenyl-6-methoxyphenol hydroxylase-like FAD-dependent oxidoreductase